MPEMVRSCYVYEQGRQSHRIIGMDIKEDWGSGGRKSPSRVQGRSPGWGFWGTMSPRNRSFLCEFHIIFSLKYNKQQLLLLLDKIHLA